MVGRVRMLLTSQGLTNGTLISELRELLGKDFSDASLAFVPTAALHLDEDLGFLVDDLVRFRDLWVKFFDIVELTALSSEDVRRRLTRADIVVVEGGHAYRLQEWFARHDIGSYLPEFLRDRVYVGISAGSMLMTPHLATSSASTLWGDLGGPEDPWRPGLALVDFYVRPHLDNPDFPTSQEPVVAAVAPLLPGTLYAVDDASALRVTADGVSAVGEGRVLTYEHSRSRG